MRRNDWLLLIALLAVGGALFFCLRPGEAALEAQIYHADEQIAVLPLSRDGTFVWQENENHVRVEVADGSVRVTQSSCPDGLCMRMGAITRAGESIVCLPNRVSVVLAGGEEALDAVVY